jgi:hypothetical protein
MKFLVTMMKTYLHIGVIMYVELENNNGKERLDCAPKC